MKKIIKNNLGNSLIILLIFLIVSGWLFSGWPQIWKKPPIPPKVQETHAIAPTFESFAENNTSGNATEVVVDKPVGTAEGDLLIAIMSHDSTAGTLGGPAGWTALFDTINTGGSTFRAWYKISGASEPSNYTFTSTDSDQLIAAIMRFIGYDSTNLINAVSSVDTGKTNAPTCPSADTTVPDTLVLRAFGADDDDITVDGGYPSGHTGILVRGSSGGWGETSIGAAYVTQASAGLTGAASFSLTANEQWGAVTIAIAPIPIPIAEVMVNATGTQTASMIIPSTNQYVGGAFTFVRNIGNADVIQIIITETGTVNASLNLSNVKLYYKQETTCSTSIPGDATPFNSIGVGFNALEKATFAGTMPVGTSQVCVYVVLDVEPGAVDKETFDIEIFDPSAEVTVSEGIVNPATPVAIAGTTTLQIPPATWMAPEDTATTTVKNENIRLRIEVANIGSSTTDDYLLEYAAKIGDFCDGDESFIAVPVTASTEPFEMTTSIYFTDGDPTTERLSNSESYTFISGRMVEDPSNISGNITMQYENCTEIEFVFQANNNATGTYCFRLTNGGTVLDEYPVYPELQITEP